MKIRVNIKSLLFFLITAVIQSSLLAGDVEELEKGKIMDKVVCQGDKNKSYALYLPTAYDPESKWPILYAFDPGARGRIPVEMFREAAEKYNYIVVGSNDARNGPWEPVLQAMNSLCKDTDQRFNLDKKRIYVTGFSGGSRAASIFSRFTALPAAGIIGCAAGIANAIIKPEEVRPAFYLGVVGITDFNYREMLILQDQLELKNIPNRFLVHDGGHDWPASDVCLRALGWMEIIGMKRRIRPVDENLISEIFEMEKADALKLESEGDSIQALAVYEELKETFSEWLDVSSIGDKIGQLKESRKYKKEIKQANEIKEEESSFLRKFYQFYSHLEKKPLPLNDLDRYILSLNLDELIKKASKGKPGKEKAMAVRLLQGLEFETSGRGWTQFQADEFEKAIYFYEIAAKAGKEDSLRKRYIYYNLACAYARTKNRKRALDNLDLAVKHGFNDIDYLEQDEDLDFIRESKEFQKIILALKQKKKLLENQSVLSCFSVNFPLEIQYCNI
jgi:hypothetical protein